MSFDISSPLAISVIFRAAAWQPGLSALVSVQSNGKDQGDHTLSTERQTSSRSTIQPSPLERSCHSLPTIQVRLTSRRNNKTSGSRSTWIEWICSKSKNQSAYPGQPERRSHGDTRHGTTTLFAALDIATGDIIGRCFTRYPAKEFPKLQHAIEANIPADLELHLVMDNYATYETPPTGACTSGRVSPSRSCRKRKRNGFAGKWRGPGPTPL